MAMQQEHSRWEDFSSEEDFWEYDDFYSDNEEEDFAYGYAFRDDLAFGNFDYPPIYD